MYIEPTSTGAQLVAKEGSFTSIRLGYYTDNNQIVPSLFLHTPNGSQPSDVRLMTGTDFAEVLAESAGSTGSYHIMQMISYPRENKAYIKSNKWTRGSSNADWGETYVDDNWYLRVKPYS